MHSNFQSSLVAESEGSGSAQPPAVPGDLEARATHLLGQLLDKRVTKPMDLVQLVHEGIDPTQIDGLVQRSKGILEPRDAGFVIARRTLSHRKSEGKPLSQEESERMIRLAKVAARAAAVFGDREKAHNWLRKPIKAFGGESALGLIQYEEGLVIVQDYLNRLDSGFFA